LGESRCSEKVMVEEMLSIEKNETWDMVDFPHISIIIDEVVAQLASV